MACTQVARMLNRRLELGIGWWSLALTLLSPVALAATLQAQLVDAGGRPLADAVLTLQGPQGAPASPVPAVMDQVQKQFAPAVLAVRTGTEVSFPNSDDIRHQVYSFSPAKRFELRLYKGTPSSPVRFDKPGVVVLGCNIHDWMAAHVLVVDTPWFAKTGADGVARIDGVPPGAYRLRVWHPRQKAAAADRDVSLGAAARRIEYTLDLTPRVIVPKPPLDAGGY